MQASGTDKDAFATKHKEDFEDRQCHAQISVHGMGLAGNEPVTVQ
jgi:hypothetical protein